MAGIFGVVKELYIRFMVWLGAAPPDEYGYLIHQEIGGPQQYTVKAGDTLFSIARKFGVHYDLIAKASNLDDPNSLQAGQKITVPQVDWDPASGPLTEPIPTTPGEIVEPAKTVPEIEPRSQPVAKVEPEPVPTPPVLSSRVSI